MKPVIKEQDSTHYVSEADLIRFIEENSNYGWDQLCDTTRDKVFSEGKTYYSGKPTGKYYDEFTIEWVGAFFDAHPFMKKIMFVFDS